MRGGLPIREAELLNGTTADQEGMKGEASRVGYRHD